MSFRADWFGACLMHFISYVIGLKILVLRTCDTFIYLQMHATNVDGLIAQFTTLYFYLRHFLIAQIIRWIYK